MLRPSKVRAPLACAVLLLFSACAAPRVTIERRPDGIVHLTCKTDLSQCLQSASRECEDKRYAVLRAFADRDAKGNLISPEIFESSEAYIRCGNRSGWGTANQQLLDAPLCPAAATPPAAPAPPVAPAPRVCTPGATQACVGPAGCHGGQACEPDGTRFSRCDCGPPSAAAP